MSDYQWRYLKLVALSWIVTYCGLMLLYGLGLLIYHYGVFLPRIKKKLKEDVDELIEPDMGWKLRELADKYNSIVPEKTQEDSVVPEKTQDDLDQKTPAVDDTPTVPVTSTKHRLKKKTSSSNNLTALSDTPPFVSRVEREPLVQKTQTD